MATASRPSWPRASTSPEAPAEPTKMALVRSLPVTRDATRDNTALVEGLRAGEPWARAALFERFGPEVQRLLRKILGPQSTLEIPDLIHDVFVRALGAIDQLREPNAMLAWMQAITTRTAFRAIRAQRARRWLRFWEPIEEIEIPARDVDRDAVEACRRTYAILDRMPAAERIIFALRYIDGMELAPIAVACEISLATVKRRLARAGQRFAAAAERDEILRSRIQEGHRWTT